VNPNTSFTTMNVSIPAATWQKVSNWLQLQLAIEAVKVLTPEQLNEALALATTKHRHQVAGAND